MDRRINEDYVGYDFVAAVAFATDLAHWSVPDTQEVTREGLEAETERASHPWAFDIDVWRESFEVGLKDFGLDWGLT